MVGLSLSVGLPVLAVVLFVSFVQVVSELLVVGWEWQSGQEHIVLVVLALQVLCLSRQAAVQVAVAFAA